MLQPFCSEAAENWQEVSIVVELAELQAKGVSVSEVKMIAVVLVGKDTEYWAGNYGARFRKAQLIETSQSGGKISSFIKVKKKEESLLGNVEGNSQKESKNCQFTQLSVKAKETHSDSEEKQSVTSPIAH